ncbi:FRG domain-containing protein [uncultured Massilia sp.]|uniref:FRG domain-containing protein n=1 Tax=uncultured Massilia sp. TaxID=169973 RepID=UPI00259005D2|nr:FRG domain-containing protein [uncultured Massilia sp.]
MEHEIKNVAEFVDYVLKVSLGQNMLYRGHSSRAYELIPSLGRHVAYRNGEKCDPNYLRQREIQVLEDFRGSSVPYIADRNRTMLDVMSQAQHHGIPTRLMDWTTNPLVALYFAVKSVKTETDGVVYVAPPPPPLPPQVRTGHVLPIDVEDLCHFQPQHIDARIAAQFSIFTLHPNPYQAQDKSKFKCAWFKGEHKELILAELHVLGVNAQLIFPGLSGIGERIRNSMFGQY